MALNALRDGLVPGPDLHLIRVYATTTCARMCNVMQWKARGFFFWHEQMHMTHRSLKFWGRVKVDALGRYFVSVTAECGKLFIYAEKQVQKTWEVHTHDERPT